MGGYHCSIIIKTTSVLLIQTKRALLRDSRALFYDNCSSRSLNSCAAYFASKSLGCKAATLCLNFFSGVNACGLSGGKLLKRSNSLGSTGP